MKLSFRYQYTLAPLIIVILLACLVAYTLFEIANIKEQHKILRDSELVSDRFQTSISSINHIKGMVFEFSKTTNLQEHDLFFNYLEQISILRDNLASPLLNDYVSIEFKSLILNSTNLLNEPVKINPFTLEKTLSTLLIKFKSEFNLLAAKKRTIFIDNHKELKAISSRLTMVLLSGLIVCIIFAIAVTHWGLSITRRRLTLLSKRAYEVFLNSDLSPNYKSNYTDELDELEKHLSIMTKSLVKSISIKNVLQGAENERRRIAMDIHDSVLTDLTTINRSLDVTNNISFNTDKINLLRADVNSVISNLRQTIDDLHPQVLETLGLESALRSNLDRQNKIPGFPKYIFEFSHEIDAILTNESKLTIFRIVIEVVNNVIKHAKCERFEINFRKIANELIITVEDNGIGINNSDKGNSQTGYGCINITERANLIGATVDWRTSRFSSGTCFEFRLLV